MTYEEWLASKNNKTPVDNTQQVSSIPVKSSLKDIRSDREKELADAQDFIERNKKYIEGSGEYYNQIGKNQPLDYTDIPEASAYVSNDEPVKKPDEFMVHGNSAKDEGVLNKFGVGIRDSLLGNLRDTGLGVKVGSGYEMHGDAWAGDYSNPENQKKIMQDLSYITGQQLADLPVIIGLNSILKVAPLTMGAYSGMKGMTEQIGNDKPMDWGKVGKDSLVGGALGGAFSGGKFFSQRQVFLLASCPKCHGCIIWSGFLIAELITETGFSMQILFIGASINFLTKSKAARVLLFLDFNLLFQWIPDTAK